MKKSESEVMSLLPKKQEPKVFIQGHIPRSLFEDVKSAMKADDITWPELFEATLTVYRNASKAKRRRQ